MSQKILFLLLIFILFPFLCFAQAVMRPNCCKLDHNISIEDVVICAPPGCDPEVPGCCAAPATVTLPEGRVVGVAEAGVVNCWLGGTVQVPIQTATPHWGMICLLDSIYTFTDIVFWLALSLAIIMGVIAGIFFLTAGGDPKKLERTKSMVFWIVVGIAVAISAKAITALVIAIVL